MKNRIISGLLIIVLMTSLVGCNQTSSKDAVEFTDFLVERCVRKQLNKGWDEDITQKELEGITSLCISSMYDPTFAISWNSLEPVYRGYIDLSDLKYFNNLEELKIDAFIYSDSIVNLDVITECKKLEKISIPYSDYASFNSINPLGYKYWKDIISELPELEYLDLGKYFDEHMQDIVLSEMNNKDIEFYFGPKGDWSDLGVETLYYQNYFASRISRDISILSWSAMQNEQSYESVWDYEYKTLMDKEYITTMNYSGTFPAIYTDDMEELERELEKISENVEDIIIVYNSQAELDFSVFEKFPNLVTLSVIGTKFEQEKYVDPSTFIQYTGDYLGATAINLDSLSNNKNLQVLNLSGFVGDISDISKIENLRELSIIDCAVDSVEFLGELESVKELILNLYTDEDMDDFYTNVDETVSSLINLKCYVDQNYSVPDTVELYENISNMEKLETLFVYDNKCLENIVNSETLKNLSVWGREEINNVSFEKMEALEVVSLFGESYAENIDYTTIVELPNIKSIAYPNGMAEEGVLETELTYDLARAITDNKNISAFCLSVVFDYDGRYRYDTDREFIRELYEAGVDDGICQHWIRCSWNDGFEYTFEDFCDAYGY